jgi:hypothetical protein
MSGHRQHRKNDRKAKPQISDVLSDTSSYHPEEQYDYLEYPGYIEDASVGQAITIPRPGLGKRKGPKSSKASKGFIEDVPASQAITMPRPGLMEKGPIKETAASGFVDPNQDFVEGITIPRPGLGSNKRSVRPQETRNDPQSYSAGYQNQSNYYNQPNSAPSYHNQPPLQYEDYYGTDSASNYDQRLQYEQPPIPQKDKSSAYSNLYQLTQISTPQPMLERSRQKSNDLSDTGSSYNLMGQKEDTKKHPSIGKDTDYTYGCIPVNKKKRTICASVSGAIVLLLLILTIVYFPRYCYY